ncbi:MAG: ribosome recycling factor [Deltaproteobacteria bacterium]|nr:MAG: ribosome recycling factor [Deltaproteobacteria bacterium]
MEGELAVGQEVIKKLEESTKKTVAALTRDLSKVRTGRASTSLLDGIKVEYYGTMTPLHQVASLAAPEGRLITIQPWEPSLIGAIEKAILKSDLGFNPQNDGKIIRIQVPPLTEERRKELVKHVHKIGESFKVAIRQERAEAMKELKKREADKAITEDESHRFQKKVQEIVDARIKEIDQILAAKEAEIMEV